MIAALSALLLTAAAPFPATFAAPDTQSAGAGSGIATADFNGDGRPDFVTAGGTDGVITVGTSTYRVNPADVTDSPTAVAVGDLNRDGRPDVVTANSGRSVSVLLGQAGGTFAPATVTTLPGPEQTLDVAVGQLTADANPDVVVTTGKNDVAVFERRRRGRPRRARLLTGRGRARPRSPSATSTATARPTWRSAPPPRRSRSCSPPRRAGASPRRSRTAPARPPPASRSPTSPATASPSCWPAAPTGRSPCAPARRSPPRRPTWSAVTSATSKRPTSTPTAPPDVVTTRDTGVSLLLNAGDGTLAAPTALTGPAARAVAIADADGDGRPDLATAGTGLVQYANTTARSRASAAATSDRRAQTIGYTATGAPMSKVRLYVKAPGASTYSLAAEQPATSGSFDYKVATDGAFAYFTTLVDADGNEEPKPATPDATTQVTLTKALTAESLSFASQLLNTSSAPAEARIVNTGEATLTLKAPSMSGADFALTSDECTGHTLKPERRRACCASPSPPPRSGVRTARVTLDAGTLDLAGAGVSPPIVIPAPLPPPAAPATPAKIGAKLVFAYKRGKLRTLSVRNVPKGATVKATRGKTTYIKRNASGTVSLARLVKKTGAKIVVTISKAGMTSVTHTLTVKTRKLTTR